MRIDALIMNMAHIQTGGPILGQAAALMNPGALLVVVGVFILIFGGCSLGDCKPRLPSRAMEWVPYACAFGIIVLVGLWLFSVINRR